MANIEWAAFLIHPRKILFMYVQVNFCNTHKDSCVCGVSKYVLKHSYSTTVRQVVHKGKVCSTFACEFMQINELFSGRPLGEAHVFSVEISNAAGSRFVNCTCTCTFIHPLRLFSFQYKLTYLSLIIIC